MKQNVVITIARQYGSGGRTVGKMLAEKLGIAYYDRDLIELASEKSGISLDLFGKNDETMVNRVFPKLPRIPKVYGGELIGPDEAGFTSDDNLFNIQAQVIRELAEKESCVIIGRCANYVLKDYDHVVSVFVHAPHDFLMEQAGKVQGFSGEELEKFIAKVDAYRAAYHHYHTGLDWTDARQYDLCVNSGRLGFDKTAEEICSYLKVRFGEDILD